MRHILALDLQHHRDVVTARQRAAQIARLLGFDVPEQTRIATAVSEIVRNAFRYATGGQVSFGVSEAPKPQRLVARVADAGPGMTHLDDVLSGRYRSASGMGIGIVGAQRLMDRFTIESTAAGTIVLLEKDLPATLDVVTSERARQIADAVASRPPDGLFEEIQQQNGALLRALAELERKQQEVVQLNRELEDTNRGVVALYAELEENADHLRRSDELKSRFLSNMTHEFRTPVNSIIGLSGLLLDDRASGEREPEPEIVYIRKAAEQLSELVNDLLDLARIEAGKTIVRPVEFDVQKLFGALRGMLRPLLVNQAVSLVFDYPADLPPLHTDEGKLSQILRNLVSNALKYTEQGEVRVSAAPPDGNGLVRFAVTDTGIGIAPEDQSRIFDEFTQLEHRLQARARGTGLGLPLSRRLAEVLGGTLRVESEPGVGSTFTVAIPARYAAPRMRAAETFEWLPEPGRLPLLVVGDDPDNQHFYGKVLHTSAYQRYPAHTAQEAEAALQRVQPTAIILDIDPGGRAAWDLLVRLRRAGNTSRTPLVFVGESTDHEKALSLGANACLTRPIDRRTLLETLTGLQAPAGRPLRVLVVDDEEAARYLVRQCLPAPAFEVTEAGTGKDGLRRAHAERPDVIVLDVILPDVDGTEVLRQLRAQPSTRDIPVLFVTSLPLDAAARERLQAGADALFSKADISRGTLGESVRAAAARTHDGREPAVPRSPRNHQLKGAEGPDEPETQHPERAARRR